MNGQEANTIDLEVERVIAAARDALTDEMVGRLTEAAGGGLALIDQVNRAGLDRAIPALAEMLNNGDLQRLVKLARVFGAAEDALTDEMIGRMAETIGNGLSLLDRLNRGGAERIVSVLENLENTGALERLTTALPKLVEQLDTIQGLLKGLDDATVASRQAPRSSGGIGGLWQMLKDPDSQDTLRFLLLFGKQLRSSGQAKGSSEPTRPSQA